MTCVNKILSEHIQNEHLSTKTRQYLYLKINNYI